MGNIESTKETKEDLKKVVKATTNPEESKSELVKPKSEPIQEKNEHYRFGAEEKHQLFEELFNEEIDQEAKEDSDPDPEPDSLKDTDYQKLSQDLILVHVYKWITDVAQSFQIQKFLMEKNALATIRNLIPSKFKLLGVYGDSQVIQHFISNAFNEEVYDLPSEEGVYMFYSVSKKRGILAFISQDKLLFDLKPMKTGNRSITIVRILTDLCFKVVTCISQDHLDNWFFEDDGKINPFIPKIHQPISAVLKTLVTQESKKEEVELLNKHVLDENFHLPLDSSDLIFSFKAEKMHRSEKKKLKNQMENLFEELKDFNAESIFSLTAFLEKFFKQFGFPGINKSKYSEMLKDVMREYMKTKKSLYDDFYRDVLTSFKKFAEFTSKYAENNFKYDVQKLLKCKEELEIKKVLEKCISYFSSRKLFEEIIKESYENYLIAQKSKSLTEFLKSLEKGLRSKFEIKLSISGYLFQESFKSRLEKLSRILQERLTPEKYLTAVSEKLFDFTRSKSSEELENLIYLKIFNFEENLIVQKKVLWIQFEDIMKEMIASSKGEVLTISTSTIQVQEKFKEKVLKCNLSEKKDLLSYYFEDKDLKVKQVISFSKDIIFVFVSNPAKRLTHVIRLKPKVFQKEDYEKINDIDDTDVLVAWGSNSNKFIIFLNNKKKSYHGSLYQNKYIKLEMELEIFTKVAKVETSSYMQKSKKLFLISDSGQLYYKELQYDDNKLTLAKQTDPKTAVSKEFSPKSGKRFCEMEITPDETILILQTDKSIECYDKNFTITHEIKLPSGFISFKTIIVENNYFMLINSSKKPLCFKLYVPKKINCIERGQEAQKIIEGNPILDIHQLGIVKFGPLNEQTQSIQGERSLGYYFIGENDERVSRYLKYLGTLKDSFSLIGYVRPSKAFKEMSRIPKSEFLFSICTRIPLHVASIQSGNLIPLQNGENNFDSFTKKIKKDSFLDNLTKYIKFSSYEQILEKIENLMVVSIIGRQSSGKSYLLNRIVGTRFDVAAERCTEGIWMGIGKIKDTFIIVFDCEGMFTVERSPQEEIKLCLFLSSLSDLVILNSDLSSGKQIITLFDQFASGVDRLRGEKLFQATLDITYRDIPDGQGEGAAYEFERFLTNLIESGRKESLSKLFKGGFYNSQYHNFENNLFNHEIEYSRKRYYQDISRKWENGKVLCMMMKTVLAQIFTDISTNVDEGMFKAKLQNIKKKVEKILSSPEKAKKLLKDETVTCRFKIEDQKLKFKVKINEYKRETSDPLIFFFNTFKSKESENLRILHHNSWFEQFNNQIIKFFNSRKTLIINFIKSNLPTKEEFLQEIEREIIYFEQKISHDSLCLRKCLKCELVCINISGHTSKCSCNTDHICKFPCSICEKDQKCSLQGGHSGRHICGQAEHKCSKKCKVPKCENQCTFEPFHKGECKCSSSHPCGKNCKMFSLCGQPCEKDRNIEHSVHSCSTKKCPFKCVFDDGKTCSSLEHFHDDSLECVKSKLWPSPVKMHICGNEHLCKGFCEDSGVCSVKTEFVTKVYKNSYNEFTYPYVNLITEKKPCNIKIEAKNLTHEEPSHMCAVSKHICAYRCPDCACFCELESGHEGFHISNSHRNKDNAIYISTDSVFEGEIYDSLKTKTAVQYVAGDSAIPEICDQYCLKKNRGHKHPIPCQGGLKCMEKTDKGYAVHSYVKFDSGTSAKIDYDLVSCETYWKKHGWIPPVESKNPEAQAIFGKCSFMCGHPSHQLAGEVVFCEGNLFHSNSESYADHKFTCVHKGSGNYDIVFIIDCTGSMSSAFPQVQKVILNLLNKWGSDCNKFAIVGYTDHFPDHGHFPSENPVSVYPPSLSLYDGDPFATSQFIANMSTGGGGWMFGEAMIDGLANANKLAYRMGSSRLYILVADDCPHGNEFAQGTTHPNGCPCGYKWTQLLSEMRANNTQFIFVKLGNILNTTVDLFQREYNNEIIAMTLDNISSFEMSVTNTVIATIETNFVFAPKSKKTLV